MNHVLVTRIDDQGSVITAVFTARRVDLRFVSDFPALNLDLCCANVGYKRETDKGLRVEYYDEKKSTWEQYYATGILQTKTRSDD